MAIDGGQIPTPTAVEEGDVAVADGDRVNLDANLARLGGTKGEVLDHEWLSERAQHCCLDLGHHPKLGHHMVEPTRRRYLGNSEIVLGLGVQRGLRASRPSFSLMCQ